MGKSTLRDFDLWPNNFGKKPKGKWIHKDLIGHNKYIFGFQWKSSCYLPFWHTPKCSTMCVVCVCVYHTIQQSITKGALLDVDVSPKIKKVKKIQQTFNLNQICFNWARLQNEYLKVGWNKSFSTDAVLKQCVVF